MVEAGMKDLINLDTEPWRRSVAVFTSMLFLL